METSIPMALLDFVPVILFLIGSIVLQRKLYDYMSKGAFALFSAGTIVVFCAGIFKAIWKLLYALGVCDFDQLNQCFFPMQSVGFLLAGIGIIALLVHSQGGKKLFATVPPLFPGTMIFVSLMVVGVGMLDGGLAIIAGKRKQPWLIPVFLFVLVCALGMGYLSSRDNTTATVNWIAEIVNTLGQCAYLVGAKLLKVEESK